MQDRLDAETLECFDLLLAYRDGALSVAEQVMVEERLSSDPRWQLHFDSLQYLDLERAVAVYDAEQLAAFDPKTASECCRTLVALEAASISEDERNRLQGDFVSHAELWSEQIMDCVLCRRIHRRTIARQQAIADGLPEGEPLLREWLLEDYYLENLNQKIQQVAEIDASALGADTAEGQQSQAFDRVFLILGSESAGIVALRHAESRVDLKKGAAPYSIGGFTWRLKRESSRRVHKPALLDDESDAVKSVLELERELTSAIGNLGIEFVTTESGTIRCGARLKQSEHDRPKDLSVRVALQGNLVLELECKDTLAAKQVDLGQAESMEGQEFRVQVWESGRVAEEFRFRFTGQT